MKKEFFITSNKKECQMNVRTTKGVKDKLQEIAKSHQTSVSDIVNQIIKEFLLNYEL